MTAFETIVAAVRANNNAIIDDHNNSHRTMTLAGLGLLSIGGREHVVALLDKTVYCLNPVRILEDGKPHLSTSSVGGNIDARVVPSLEYALEYFNAFAKDNTFSPQHLVQWELFEPVEVEAEIEGCFKMLDQLAVVIHEQKTAQATALGDRHYRQATNMIEEAELQVTVLRQRIRKLSNCRAKLW